MIHIDLNMIQINAKFHSFIFFIYFKGQNEVLAYGIAN